MEVETITIVEADDCVRAKQGNRERLQEVTTDLKGKFRAKFGFGCEGRATFILPPGSGARAAFENLKWHGFRLGFLRGTWVSYG